MPESRRRKKQAYTPPANATSDDSSPSRVPVNLDGARWIAPVMVTLFILGLLWIVIWYISPDNPVMGPLAGWNVAIGFVFIAGGFLLSTKWQ